MLLSSPVWTEPGGMSVTDLWVDRQPCLNQRPLGQDREGRAGAGGAGLGAAPGPCSRSPVPWHLVGPWSSVSPSIKGGLGWWQLRAPLALRFHDSEISGRGAGPETPPQQRRALPSEPPGCRSPRRPGHSLCLLTWRHLLHGHQPCQPGTAGPRVHCTPGLRG